MGTAPMPSQEARPGAEPPQRGGESRGGAPGGVLPRSQGEAAHFASAPGGFADRPGSSAKLPRFPALRPLGSFSAGAKRPNPPAASPARSWKHLSQLFK